MEVWNDLAFEWPLPSVHSSIGDRLTNPDKLLHVQNLSSMTKNQVTDSQLGLPEEQYECIDMDTAGTRLRQTAMMKAACRHIILN